MADELGGANIGFGQGANPLGYFGRLINDFTGKTSTNQFNAAEAEKARLFNSAEAEKQRQWETMMSNTAYQRAVSDMKAAGINPASLGGNGSSSPASTPSGATANGVAAHSGEGSNFLTSLLGVVVSGIGNALKNEVARSALSVKKDGLDLKKFEAQSRDIFRAASIADKEANTALRKAKEEHDYRLKSAKASREGEKLRSSLDVNATRADLNDARNEYTRLKSYLLKKRIHRYG